ncbi:MarR family winged helix-turn-helix transcriptional regulator [Microlunatus speluncae]|uniref:MarR family winged helix-turn-helix transcriptional regulator n=1 Tax=Microlunatus speluncae TaxID=2594267 RepID=UPI00126609A4|nr:MarR family transcriptional regulator [Microlunatus speluncae]
MADRESRLEEVSRLSQMLIDIVEEAKADFTRIAAGFDLPVHLARAVLALNRPAPMRELAEQLTCDRSYITNLADQLEERGLVSRVPGEDRRVKLLQLTRSGRSLRDRLSAAVAEDALVLRRLTAADRKTLAPLLEKLLTDEPR